MKSILFVCTGNTCRSPMARAIFIHLLEQDPEVKAEDYQIFCAGIFARDGIRPSTEAVQVLARNGIDISNHRSCRLDGEMIAKADLVLAMGNSHRDYLRQGFPQYRDKFFTLGEFTGHGQEEVADPMGGGIEAYERCERRLRALLQEVLQRIKR